MSVINYSKWAHIEARARTHAWGLLRLTCHLQISDDEDDTHPNVDTPSLFRWRHQARLEREETKRKEKAKRMLESET